MSFYYSSEDCPSCKQTHFVFLKEISGFPSGDVEIIYTCPTNDEEVVSVHPSQSGHPYQDHPKLQENAIPGRIK